MFSLQKASHVLSGGSMDFGCMVHEALLNGPNFAFLWHQIIGSCGGFRRRNQLRSRSFTHTLSPVELEEASRFIRQHWPHARILVLREGEVSFSMMASAIAPAGQFGAPGGIKTSGLRAKSKRDSNSNRSTAGIGLSIMGMEIPPKIHTAHSRLEFQPKASRRL
jgi:hypothetical protein